MAYIGNSPDLNESVDTAQLKSPLTGDLGLGADADGTDRILTFGHSTLKSVIGIDDSADIFAINTDDAFEAANDLEIDTSGNVTISNGTLTINADDTGADVRFYSATTNEGLLYDASEDELGLLLTTKLKFHDIGGGEEIYASGDGALVMNSGTSLTVTTPDMTLTSATASKPILHITNTHDLTTSGELRFNKDSTGDDNDVMGLISFYGTDSSDNTHERLAYMDAIVTDSAHASEAASMRFYVAENDATLTQGLAIAGQADADGEIDVTIGAGAASTCTVAGGLTVTSDISTLDDKGLALGTGNDFWFGTSNNEAYVHIYKGDFGVAGNEGHIGFNVGDGSYSTIYIYGGQGGNAELALFADQLDDASDYNVIVGEHDGTGMIFGNYADSVWDFEFRIADDAVTSEHTISVATVDYAEFFEWKTYLEDDDEVKALYGMTVVLDGDKVRIAEVGEEADVLGVVRPSSTSSVVGGDGMNWSGKHIENVWGEEEREPYVSVNWHILNEKGASVKHYNFMKDKIPQYELIDSPNQDIPNHHLLDSNFKRDEDGNKIPLVVPSTPEEKLAHNYTEGTEHRVSGKPNTRRIYNPEYDPEQKYINRRNRRTEWCIVGLLGQVQIRDTAVIPDHWKKMKNLESGIDMYYIK